MKTEIQTTKSALLDAVRAVEPIVEMRATIPVLGSIRFQDGKLTATNLDIEVSTSLATRHGRMEKPFTITARHLRLLARHLPDDLPVTIKTDDHRDDHTGATIETAESKYDLAGYPVADFPDFPNVVFGETNNTGNAGIIAAMKRISFAMSNEETRYYLNGIYFGEHNGAPVVVATDGHRLAMTILPATPDALRGILLPSELIKYLISRKVEPSGVASRAAEKGAPFVRFDYPGLTVKAKTIDGTYPQFGRVIPKSPIKRATINRLKMIKVLTRIQTLQERKGRAVKLEFTDSSIVISVTNPDFGTGSETFTAFTRHFAGPHSAGFNCQYLIEALSAFTANLVEYAQDDRQSPASFTAADDGLTVVLMPMRV